MNSDRIFNVIIVVLMGFVGYLAYQRLYGDADYGKRIQDIGRTMVTSREGHTVTLSSLLAQGDKTDNTHLLILELENCESCLYKGITDIQSLAKSGNHTLVVVVNDWPIEVKSWAEHYPDIPIFAMPKSTFYNHFNLSYLPAILRIEGEKVVTHRDITI